MRLTKLAVGVAVAGVLAGCGAAQSAPPEASGDAPTTQEWTAPRSVPPGMGSPDADGSFPRTVSHFGGETTIPAEPERVVVISTGQLDGVLRLGVTPVGSTSGDGAGVVPAYLLTAYPDQADGLRSMQDLGTRNEPNLEAIASARPDLILANEAGAGESYAALSAVAPTVLTEGTGVNWKQDFLLMAAALGRTTAAEQILTDFHADGIALGTEVGPEVSVSMVRFNSDRIRVFGVASFAGSIAEDAGLARPRSQRFDDTSKDLSEEQLAQADGDWIFYGVQGGENAAATALDDPLWKSNSGVEAGQAVKVDDDVWYLNAGPTAAQLVLEQLRTTLTS